MDKKDLKRYGYFYLPFPDNDITLKNIQDCIRVLEFVPLRVEAEYCIHRLKYEGYSPYFKEIKLGMVSLEYSITLKTNKDGKVSLEKVEVL